MKKKLTIKRLLFLMFLTPLLPIFPAIGGIDGQQSNDAGAGEGNEEEENTNQENAENENTEVNKLSLTQEELDELISKRVNAAKKKTLKDFEDKQNKAQEKKRIENLSEVERLKHEIAERDKQIQEMQYNSKKNLIKTDVISKATALNIINADAAYKLMNLDDIDVTDDGEVVGVNESLQTLIKEMPFLIKQAVKSGGDDQNQDSLNNKKKGNTMNDLIRKAAGII